MHLKGWKNEDEESKLADVFKIVPVTGPGQ